MSRMGSIWTVVRRRALPQRATLRQDAVAGLPGAISNVPDGMAAAVLAGVSPIHGLYACFAGPVAGGLSTSTRLMVVTTTSAAALAAGSALQGVDSDDRLEALFLMTLLAGGLMVLAGVLRLGRFTRFVSHSVMLGFLTGIAVNIVFGQISDLTGATGEGSFAAARALDIVLHPSRIDVWTLVVGLAAIAIVTLLDRTPLSSIGSLIALVVPTVVVVVFDLSSVATVADAGSIPSGLPLPHLPELRLVSLSTLSGAFAIAAIVLVQGAGVAESAPNPDRSRSDANVDFIAQGVGNLASGLFRGQPVGGSVGQTALNISSGARSRWGGIFSGLWMLLILVAFSGLVGRVAMATLAGVLIYAAIGSLRIGTIVTVWRTGATSQVAMVTTFVATLTLPVAAAVGIGVALSLLLQLNQEALDLSVVELTTDEDGRLVERPAPTELHDRHVTVLDVYGSLLYAGSRTLQVRLPDPAGAERPAVVLRLRGRTTLGATFAAVIADYAERLDETEGKLFLSGVAPGLSEMMERSGRLRPEGPVEVFAASDVLGDSSRTAVAAAHRWVDGSEDASTS